MASSFATAGFTPIGADLKIRETGTMTATMGDASRVVITLKTETPTIKAIPTGMMAARFTPTGADIAAAIAEA